MKPRIRGALHKLVHEIRASNGVGPVFRKVLARLSSAVERTRVSKGQFQEVLRAFSLRPRGLDFETTNVCNADCAFCAYGQMERKKGVMEMGVFLKAIREYVGMGGGDIGFTPVVGDPLVDPRIVERVRVARSFPQIRSISFYTNGILFYKAQLAESILSAGVNRIVISIGGFDRESYRRVYGVDEFEHVYRGILHLTDANRRLGRPAQIHLALRIDRKFSEVRSQEAFRQIASRIDGLDQQYRFDSWGGKIEADRLTGEQRLRAVPPQSHPCAILFSGLTVMWNGDVTICGCRDLEGDRELVLGNVRQQPLLEMWRGMKLLKLREEFGRVRVPEVCRDCALYNPHTLYRSPKFVREAAVLRGHMSHPERGEPRVTAQATAVP